MNMKNRPTSSDCIAPCLIRIHIVINFVADKQIIVKFAIKID